MLYERHPLLSKVCVWPEGQILAGKYGDNLKKHICSAVIGTEDEKMRIFKEANPDCAEDGFRN